MIRVCFFNKGQGKNLTIIFRHLLIVIRLSLGIKYLQIYNLRIETKQNGNNITTFRYSNIDKAVVNL